VTRAEFRPTAIAHLLRGLEVLAKELGDGDASVQLRQQPYQLYAAQRRARHHQACWRAGRRARRRARKQVAPAGAGGCLQPRLRIGAGLRCAKVLRSERLLLQKAAAALGLVAVPQRLALLVRRQAGEARQLLWRSPLLRLGQPGRLRATFGGARLLRLL